MKYYISILALLLIVSCSSSNEGITPLMLAARAGDNSQVESLISTGAEIDKKSKYGWTALMFAAWQGHKSTVENLIKAGADPNIVSAPIPSGFMATRGGYHSTTALAEATQHGHTNISYYLLKNGATPDGLVVAYAGKKGDISLLTYLKKQGVDFNKYSNSEFAPSALCSSSASGDLKTVQWLNKNGAKINIVLGHSLPLESAIRNTHVHIVRYLLENNADPNISTGDPSYHHSYPLGNAVMRSPSDPDESSRLLAIIDLLLKYGADTSIVDNGKQTILDRKLLQYDNGQKYEAKHTSKETSQEVLTRFRISNEHDNAVIEKLKKLTSQ